MDNRDEETQRFIDGAVRQSADFEVFKNPNSPTHGLLTKAFTQFSEQLVPVERDTDGVSQSSQDLALVSPDGQSSPLVKFFTSNPRRALQFEALAVRAGTNDGGDTVFTMMLSPVGVDDVYFYCVSPGGCSAFGKYAENATKFLETEQGVLKRAAEQIVRQMEADKRVADWEREACRKKRVICGIAATAAAALVAGVAFAVNRFVFEPAARDAAARAEYDSQGHTLPGEGLDLAGAPIVEIPASEFSEIPPVKGGDNLTNPRTVDIMNGECKDLSVSAEKLVGGHALHVAVSPDSQFIGDRFFWSKKSDGTLQVCVDADPGDKGLIAVSVTP